MKRISAEKLNSFAKESRVTPEFKKKLAAYKKYKKKFGELDFDTVGFTMSADELTEAIDYCISVNKHFHDVFPLPDDYGDGVNMYG